VFARLRYSAWLEHCSPPVDAGVDLRDVQIAARHAEPRTTMRYDRARKNLDRHPNYILAAYMASAGPWVVGRVLSRPCSWAEAARRIQVPLAGDALQGVLTAIVEFDS
jgi:hypothetical protein